MTAALSGIHVENVAFCLKSLPTHALEHKKSEPETKFYPNLVEPFMKNVFCLSEVQICTKSLSFSQVAEWRRWSDRRSGIRLWS